MGSQNIFILETGDVLALNGDKAKKCEMVVTGATTLEGWMLLR